MTHNPAPPSERHALTVGYATMDETHDEFEKLIKQALHCADADLLEHIERMRGHLKAHFFQEDQWMRESSFPAGACHIDEHASVLHSADEVYQLVSSGNLNIGRAFIRELDEWFPAHVDYLDSALAAWLSKRRFGGAPVALHPMRKEY